MSHPRYSQHDIEEVIEREPATIVVARIRELIKRLGGGITLTCDNKHLGRLTLVIADPNSKTTGQVHFDTPEMCESWLRGFSYAKRGATSATDRANRTYNF